MKSGTIKLPAIFVKQANFSHVKLSLNWMSNVLQGVRDGEEKISHSDLYNTGLEMINCAMLNLDSENIFEVKDSLASIATFSGSQKYAELSQLQFKK